MGQIEVDICHHHGMGGPEEMPFGGRHLQHLLDEAKFKALHAMSPLGRSSTPEDVASTVLFALQNQSITGTTLLVDGGQHLQRFERDFSMM